MITLKKTLTLATIVAVLFNCSSPPNEAKENIDTTAKKKANPVSFDYEAPKPQDGTLMGAIILGSAGFDAFTIKVDTAQNWELVEAQYGVSQVYENNVSENAVKEGLQTYISSIIENGVGGNNIHFLVSSSAKENEKVQAIKAVLEGLGYVVNEVSEYDEGRYAFYASVPKDFRDESFSVDVGSGNTKISWLKEGEFKTVSSYGSKYHIDSVDDKTAYDALVKASLDIPEANIAKAFIIGGAPFKLAKEVRQGDERFTVLAAPNAYTSIDDQKTKNGLNIYDAIRFSTKSDQFIFDWHSNFAIGYLLLLEQ